MITMASSLDCTAIDNAFGPYAGECRGGLDFTLLFEDAILGILPLGLALIASAFRFMYLSREGIKVIPNVFLYVKLTSWFLFSATQLTLLVLWAQPLAPRSKLTTTSVSISLTAALIFAPLSYKEHRRSIKPSFILSIYLLFTLIFDVAHTRTVWLLESRYTPVAAVTTTATALKFLLLILEVIEKRRILRPDQKDSPPYATSGIINRSFFWWLNPLFRLGYSKTLAVKDLFSLDQPLTSVGLRDALEDAWNCETPTKRTPHALFFTLLRTLKWPLLASVFPRLCLIGFNYTQPFLITAAIDLSQSEVTPQSQNEGYGLIGAYILVYVGIAVSMGLYQHLTYRSITMARGGLISLLYAKTVELSVTAIDPTAAVTLMSADIERIHTGWQTIHDIWANVIEIGLAIFLLYRQLGIACLIPVAVAIFSMSGSIVASALVMPRQALWLQAIEKRIAATAAMLNAMKGIKMFGLTDVLTKTLQDLRVKELNISKKFRKILVWNMVFSFSTPVIAPILTFTVFSVLARNSGSGRTLDTNRVFTSLSLFTLLSDPLGSLVMGLANFMGSVGSIHRIQEFLESEVRADSREVLAPFEHHKTAHQPSASSSATQSVLDVDIPPDYPFAIANAIIVQDASFGWEKEKHPILTSINMTVPQHKFTMLIGPVGCGKSTVLKAILGEAITMEGRIQISNPEVAFCDQTPWHMNGSIRQSIIGVASMDEHWYDSVVLACALKEDFKHLPKGDRTAIGSSGIALSGGQSQRIALARAVYARKDIMVLDDVFRGLDPESENQIFYNLFNERGLLRKHQTTVLLASSSVKRLPYADHIIVLDSERKVSEQGTFSGLNEVGGYVASLNLSPPDWKEDTDAILPFYDGAGKSGKTPYREAAFSEKLDFELLPEEEEEAITDDASRRVGDTSVYIYYFKAVGWLPTIIFVVGMCGFVVCFSLPPIWVRWWAKDNALYPNAHMAYYLGIYGLLGGLSLICLIVAGWEMIINMVPKSGENFHWILLNTVLKSPMSFFSTTDSGITLNRFSQDLQLIDMDLPVAALNTFATLILCLAQIIIIGVSSIYAPISFPIILGLLYLIQRVYLRTSRQIRLLDLEAKSPLYTTFLETLQGLPTIRAFSRGPHLISHSLSLLDVSQKPFYALFAVQRWLVLVLDLVVAGIAILLCVLVVSLRGTIDAGFVGVALLNVVLFGQSVKLLLTYWTNLETHIGSIARVKAFTKEAKSEESDLGGGERKAPPDSWPERGEILFEGVSAGYKTDELVLKNVTLSIPAGEKFGICGRTGSGKSTLLTTLFRLLPLAEGTIKIDSIPINTIPLQYLRTHLNIIPQDPYFLAGSVRLNADPLGQANDDDIIAALKIVELWNVVLEKVRESKETDESKEKIGKGDTKGMKEQGLGLDIEKLHLSCGQQQVFCLARAILRKSQVLVLDEATSSVDTQTDNLMQSILRSKFHKQTIIAVAHRLDTILDFDRVAVLEDGELVEVGPPYELLAMEGGRFRALYYSGQREEDGDLGSVGKE
ncbi:hypothetical protein HYFRA_00000331 [Hymenoscyphus fraxineus]|uniref:ABC transporter n=1 Tax=Hymenoscyphus fraxineus TaxID=746836 RepID=A0A9N9L4I9_9HELO|nr:hypothetical protein HYFRA_00000331 [Hymenoscyphus fraxineus]